MNISTKFPIHLPYVSEEELFKYFFANLTFCLPWLPIKFSGLDKIHMVGRVGWGLLFLLNFIWLVGDY